MFAGSRPVVSFASASQSPHESANAPSTARCHGLLQHGQENVILCCAIVAQMCELGVHATRSP